MKINTYMRVYDTKGTVAKYRHNNIIELTSYSYTKKVIYFEMFVMGKHKSDLFFQNGFWHIRSTYIARTLHELLTRIIKDNYE